MSPIPTFTAMPTVHASTYESLLARYTAAGQGHVFHLWSSLNPTQQTQLLSQLTQLVPPAKVSEFYTRSIQGAAIQGSMHHTLEPLPPEHFDSVVKHPDAARVWREIGLAKIAQNKVAVILLAGGQGTRLGSSQPKGCYDVGLPSHKSLFEIQAQRILRLQKLAADKANRSLDEVVIPWYIMTSGPTRAATEKHFMEHNYFGLDANNVIFFDQGVLPCLTKDGKILMEKPYQVAVAPDGNGGIYSALRVSGILADLEARDIDYVHSYCVDNSLVRVADPTFIGYCVSKGADCGAKVVPKSSPEEPVGVICLRDNLYSVVEYSEISTEMAHQRNEDDHELTYNAGNICNHFYTRAFLNRVESFENKLGHHIAHKKIKHIDLETGDLIEPKIPNGMKLELFVFDVFPFAENMAILEVERKEEFSPLKNAPGTGVDCPETSRMHTISQHVRFVEKAGGRVQPGDGESLDNLTFEISPLVTYAGEGLETLNGATIVTPALIHSAADLKKYAQHY